MPLTTQSRYSATVTVPSNVRTIFDTPAVVTPEQRVGKYTLTATSEVSVDDAVATLRAFAQAILTDLDGPGGSGGLVGGGSGGPRP